MSMFKRAKLMVDDDPADSKKKTMAVHSGTFQADEAMGAWMLRQLPAYRHAKLVRSRDLKVLEPIDIVLDVGGVYDHSKLRYDHHQRGYEEYFFPKKTLSADGSVAEEKRCTKLSASGLIYKHYGKDVIQTFYPDLSEEFLELAYHRIYDTLLEALDAIDTGVEMAPEGAELVYSDATGLARRVGRLNPRWNEVSDDGSKPDSDERFLEAMEICGHDFVAVMTVVVESDLPARTHVADALSKRAEIDSSEEIIKLESGGLPWKKHLYDLEKEGKISKEIKFVLYTDTAGMWRVQAVTVEGKAFENRLSLVESWRGVRDAELVAATSIPGARFVHSAGFIGGADTYEGALKMAQETLKQVK